MAKRGNSAQSKPFKVTLSSQSIYVLETLAAQGVFGRNPSEVGGRFIDEAIRNYIDLPKLKLKPLKAQLKSGAPDAQTPEGPDVKQPDSDEESS